MKITILGCGSSGGVPSFSRGFGVCDPKNPKNWRTRAALLIEEGDTRVLFDSGPDIRMQLIHAGMPSLSGVVYTHAHYDHIGGADDLKGLKAPGEQTLPLYMMEETQNSFKSMFHYLFSSDTPPFKIHPVYPFHSFGIRGIQILPILQYHGDCKSLGFRIGHFAYSTDVKTMNDEGFEALKGIKTWVLGLTTPNQNHKHVHLDEAFQWINRIQPDRVYLTHMGARMDYDSLLHILPDKIRPAYDGLSFEV